MTMNFNEAASHAKRMKGSFTAFEKLEDVLKVAAQAENAASEAETKHHALVKENAVLEVRASKLLAEGEVLALGNLQKIAAAERDTVRAASDAKGLRDQILAEIAAAEEAARKAGELAKAKLLEELAAVERERAATQGRLDAAKAEIKQMRQDVERLADGRV